MPRPARLRWYADMVSVFRENHIAWSNWEYKADFGIVAYDTRARKDGPVDWKLIHILLAH